jgi:signal transduction histidine kinase
MQPLLCPWEPSSFLFFSSNVPALVHYSHLVALIAALAVGVVIFVNNPHSTVSRLLLLFTGLFSIWVLLDLVLWATNDPAVVMFAWSLQVLIEPLTYAVAFLAFYIFIYKSWPPFSVNLLIVLMLLPIVGLLSTTYTLEGLVLSSCESIEGFIAKYYTYTVHFTLVVMLFATSIMGIRTSRTTERRIAITLGIGILTFLLSFSSGNLISSFTDNWTLSQYGLFGMPFFAGLMAYGIVRFEAFHVKTFATQVLVVVLAGAVLSLVALQRIQSVRIVASLTFLLVCMLGYVLVRSVRREIQQKERNAELAEALATSNERLKQLDMQKSEFLSIATHQLRGPLAAIRGHLSLLLDGSYGAISEEARKIIAKVFTSGTLMTETVNDFLNVSRIEQGSMQYEYTDFNVSEMVKDIVEELQPAASDHNLTLTLEGGVPQAMVHADYGKIRHIFFNLTDNAIKYTPQGWVKATVHVQPKVVRVELSDSGIGIAPDKIDTLFQKFVRMREATGINISGTGLGLYVAKQMVEAHNGKIWAESAGLGKGTTFVVELPLSTHEPKEPASHE